MIFNLGYSLPWNCHNPVYHAFRKKENAHGMSGETVNQGIVNIDLQVRLLFGGKGKSMVNRGRW